MVEDMLALSYGYGMQKDMKIWRFGIISSIFVEHEIIQDFDKYLWRHDLKVKGTVDRMQWLIYI